MADVSVIIVNYNTKELLLNSINSVIRQNCWIIVIDNGSSDGSAEAVRQQYPEVQLIRNEQNQGFARAVNQGLQLPGRKDYHLILNSDATLTADYIGKTVSFMESNPKCAIVTGQLLNDDNSRQNSFDNFPGLLSEFAGKSLLRILMPDKYRSKKQDCHGPIEVESVIGAAMMVRQKAIEQAGLLDENYFFFLEETDWCYRMRQKGWSVCFLPDAAAYDLQGETKKQMLIPAKIEYLASLYKFFDKNYGKISGGLLRLIKALKITLGLIIHLLLIGLTLGLSRRFRARALLYSHLLIWHLRFCTNKMTLRHQSQNK